MITKNDVNKNVDTEAVGSFSSKLSEAPARFLAHVIEHSLSVGRRSAGDFVRHFSPAQIMAGLEARPNLRADILEPTTGVRRKIAVRKSAASAGDDLKIALNEGEATAEQVVQLLTPDDRVRYLDNQLLWSFVAEGDFWRIDAKSGPQFEQAKSHIAFILDRALADGLLSHADVIGGVSIDNLAQSLPRDMLASIIKASLERGRQNKAFTEKELLETAASRILVEDMSLDHIWQTVIEPKIARAHGFSNETVAEVVEVGASVRIVEVDLDEDPEDKSTMAGPAEAKIETQTPKPDPIPASDTANSRTKETAQLSGTIEIIPPTAIAEVKTAKAMNVAVSSSALTKPAAATTPVSKQEPLATEATAAGAPEPITAQGTMPASVVAKRTKTDSWSVSSSEALDDLGDAIEELEVDDFEIEEEFESSPPTATGPSPVANA